MLQTIERFNQHAVKHNLSAGAILLWQRLYITMQHKGQFADVQQNTAVLTAQLDVSRQGLQQMRQALIDKGFLQIRQDGHQQIFYTLMINGRVVGEKPMPQSCDNGNNGDNGGPLTLHRFMDIQRDVQWPSPTNIAIFDNGNPVGVGALDDPQTGDLILTNRIRPYIDRFCQQFGNDVKPELLQWAEMRRKNGWTLTLWGLEETLKKLVTLAEGKAEHMAEIIRQSVNRRWKGFFPLSRRANPSGEKLRKQEAKQTQQHYQKPWQKPNPAHKFKPEGRDLSFLEF